MWWVAYQNIMQKEQLSLGILELDKLITYGKSEKVTLPATFNKIIILFLKATYFKILFKLIIIFF